MFFASQTFTNIHVAITLVAIVAGLIWLYGLLRNGRMPAITAVFLLFTVLTSLTGFLFPFHGVTPAIIVGIISCVLLALALAGLYLFHLAGAWRWIYVVTAVMSLYLNCFVLVVQSFQKVPALHVLAPTGAGPVFGAAQLIVLVAFAVAGYLGVRRFRRV
ncbi:MAG: hypothetical protein WDN03_02360 [Rhizomicrobium sp.]